MDRFKKAEFRAAVGAYMEQHHRGAEDFDVGDVVATEWTDGTEGEGSWTRGRVDITAEVVAEAKRLIALGSAALHEPMQYPA